MEKDYNKMQPFIKEFKQVLRTCARIGGAQVRNPSREASVSTFEASFSKLHFYGTAVSKMKTDTHRK